MENTGKRKLRSVLLAQIPPDPRPTSTEFSFLKEPGEDTRNIFDRTMVYYRWQWLMSRKKGFTATESSRIGELGRGAERLEFAVSKDRTLIKVIVPRNARRLEDTDLLIRVPAKSRLNITTVSADIAVRAVRGTQRLQSVSGDLDLAVFDEDVEAKTVSGDMEISGHEGTARLTLTAISGDLDVSRVGGELMVSTVSGELELSTGTVSRLKVRTTNGDMEIDTLLGPAAHVDIETINGDVTLSLRGGRDGEYDIETFNGDIDNCFGPKARRTSKYAPGRELRFNEGEAGADIRIKTLNGAVEICDH